MMKIIIPTDFSENAWNALFTTIKLYSNISCHFYILNTFEPKELNFIGKSIQQRLGIIYDSMAKNSAQELEKILTYLNKNHSNTKHSFETISKSYTLNEALRVLVRTNEIDLIAIGTQGATGAKEIFIGSNTVKVLKQITKCPILVIPTGYNFQQLKTLVFPTNFFRVYEKYELSPLIELASVWESEIQVLHITLEDRLNEKQQKVKEILEEQLKPLNHSFHNEPFEKNISNAIEKYTTNNKSDLVAMIRNHHTFWEKIIGEPVIKKTAFHSKIPVMMLSEK